MDAKEITEDEVKVQFLLEKNSLVHRSHIMEIPDVSKINVSCRSEEDCRKTETLTCKGPENMPPVWDDTCP